MGFFDIFRTTTGGGGMDARPGRKGQVVTYETVGKNKRVTKINGEKVGKGEQPKGGRRGR